MGGQLDWLCQSRNVLDTVRIYQIWEQNPGKKQVLQGAGGAEKGKGGEGRGEKETRGVLGKEKVKGET